VGSFEIIEHTADVGIRATATTLEELFEQVTFGLADIMGISTKESGAPEPIAVASDDLGGLLVDWLSEVLYVHEVRDALLASVRVHSVGGGRATGDVELVGRTGEVDGTQVKAITYHQLKVQRLGKDWIAQVYVDV
jgi:SHS2 domain-containing protein